MTDVPRLEQRPEAKAFAVEALLQYVKDGKIRLPEFQRPQRWRSSHVLELFDSIYRGLPIGTFLFAKREAEAKRLRFGPLEIQAPRVAEGLFMVDGQQRMTALAGALLHPSQHPRGDIHAVWFDLEEDKFVRNVAGTTPHHWIPLNVVGDSFKQLTWLNDWPLRGERPDLVRRALALGKAIREYQVPVYVVEGASEDALRLIFKRTNSSGVAMKEHEVFEALYGGGGKPLRAVLSRIEETGFGDIGEDWLLRCLKAVEGADPRARFMSERDLDISTKAVETTETALRRVIAFLVGWSGIPHQQLLPYRLPLLILARFFHLYPEPDLRTRALLVRWVWRGALSGVHMDTGDVTVSELQARLEGGADRAVEALIASVPREVELPSPSVSWNGRHAHTRLCALALFHLGARDPETGVALDVEAVQVLFQQRGQIGDVYRRIDAPPPLGPQTGLWESARASSDTDADTSLVAHRFLVADQTKLRLLLDASDEVLRSHAMDAEAVAAYRRGDMKRFEQRRIVLLDDAFRRFFWERCAIGESDRPSIAAILRRVEESAA